MMFLIALYLYTVSAALLIMILWQHAKGTRDLLCTRNLALVGFITFQLSSVGIKYFEGHFTRYSINDPVGTGITFALFSTVFLVIALVVYQRGWLSKWLAAHIPSTKIVPGSGSLLMMSIILTLMGAALNVGVRLPLIGILASILGVGFAAIACGLVGWVWGKRLLNPALITIGTIIVVANLGNVLMGAFGRRGLVAVTAAMVWGMYYAHWRYLPARAMMLRLAIISIVPIILLALFTSVRDPGEHSRTTSQHLQAMSKGSVVEGIKLLLDGQNTGGATCWVIENYPEKYNYRPLLTIEYFLVYPVPRSWWNSKPIPLSNYVARQARVKGVDKDAITLPAGIIGNSASEGGWIALIIYAILAGFLLRFLDETITINAFTPFIVLPFGSALGQVLGLARGETSVFAWLLVTTVIGTSICLYIVGKFVEASGWVPHFLAVHNENDEENLNTNQEQQQLQYNQQLEQDQEQPEETYYYNEEDNTYYAASCANAEYLEIIELKANDIIQNQTVPEKKTD